MERKRSYLRQINHATGAQMVMQYRPSHPYLCATVHIIQVEPRPPPGRNNIAVVL